MQKTDLTKSTRLKSTESKAEEAAEDRKPELEQDEETLLEKLEQKEAKADNEGESDDDDDLSFIELDGEIEPAVVDSDDDELLILSPLTDEFDEKVAEAQEQLLHLRHQQEQLEKQKAELEELKRKREKFLRGRAEATDRLTKATTMLEREMFEAQRRMEQFGHAREAFERHLENLDAINPDEWERDEVRSQLARALAAIQDAREEYTTEMARVGALTATPVAEIPAAPLPVEVANEVEEQDAIEATNSGASTTASAAVPASSPTAPVAEVRDFMYWLKSGFAFTLPLLIFGIFALFLVLVIF